MSKTDNTPEKSLVDKGFEAAGKAASLAVTKAAERGIESIVPAPLRDSVSGLIDKSTKPADPKKDDPKLEAAPQGAPAAATTQSSLDKAFEEGRKLGEQGKKAAAELKDGVVGSLKQLVTPATPAPVAATAVSETASKDASTSQGAPTTARDAVIVPTPAVKAAIKEITDVLGTTPPAKDDPKLGAKASEPQKSEFDPRFKKSANEKESVYERALKAMQANDKAAGKEPHKYEALNAAVEVAAQSTPAAKPAGKGHTK